MANPMTQSPFTLIAQTEPLVALCGARNGYIQLATHELNTRYESLPMALFEAARDWAATLEALGAQRVYWITLSEVVTHLHIHLYPRWPGDTDKGIPLFEARETAGQPSWMPLVEESLQAWAKKHNVYVRSYSA